MRLVDLSDGKEINLLGMFTEWKDTKKGFPVGCDLDLVWESFPVYYYETIIATIRNQNDCELSGFTKQETKRIANRIYKKFIK